MDKMLAVVFNDEKTAYEGARALSDLNTEGSITVDAVAVVTKNADGSMSTRKVDGDFPIRTLAGTALGSVIGVLGGAAGLAAGSAIGAFAGLIGDLYASGIEAGFLADVSTTLAPGKYALLAEIDEDRVTPVDTRMEALGGIVHRTPKETVEEDHWSREVATARAQLAQLKAEQAQARADRKAKLQAQIDLVSRRIDEKIERAKVRSQQIALDIEAKLKALQQKADKEKGDSKAALEARIVKLRNEYQSRTNV